jgi:hypothetical protein
VQYFGAFTRVKVAAAGLAGLHLQADLPPGTTTVEPGATTHLHWDAAAVHALAPAAA